MTQSFAVIADTDQTTIVASIQQYGASLDPMFELEYTAVGLDLGQKFQHTLTRSQLRALAHYILNYTEFPS